MNGSDFPDFSGCLYVAFALAGVGILSLIGAAIWLISLLF